MLTAYDGESITYDEIGNPTSCYNVTRWSFDWENGRRLTTAESSSHDIGYTYDMVGIRVERNTSIFSKPHDAND